MDLNKKKASNSQKKTPMNSDFFLLAVSLLAYHRATSVAFSEKTLNTDILTVAVLVQVRG